MADDFDFVDDPAYTDLLFDELDRLEQGGGGGYGEGGGRTRTSHQVSDKEIILILISAFITFVFVCRYYEVDPDNWSFLFCICFMCIYCFISFLKFIIPDSSLVLMLPLFLIYYLICFLIRIPLYLFRLLIPKRRRKRRSNERTITIDNGANGNVYGNNSNRDGVYNPYGGHPIKLRSPFNNTVIVTGGKVKGSVYGGHTYVCKADGISVTASGNSVTINGGVVGGNDSITKGYVYGGDAICSDSEGCTVTASGNSVTINDGMVKESVYGGHAWNYNQNSLGGSDGNTITASDNSVTINGGVVKKSVYGGYAASSKRGIATATNNTVTINGNPIFNPSATRPMAAISTQRAGMLSPATP